jgi:hypothetical protein
MNELAIWYHSRKSIITFPLYLTSVSRAEEDPSAKMAKVEVPQVRPVIMPNSLGMAFPPRPAYGVAPPMYVLYFLLPTCTNLMFLFPILYVTIVCTHFGNVLNLSHLLAAIILHLIL